GNDLTRLAWAIEFAQRAVRVLRRNLLWAFAYNTIGIALAATGRLNPALAALLMVVSSALVIRRSLSLQRDDLNVGVEASISELSASGGRKPTGWSKRTQSDSIAVEHVLETSTVAE